MPLRIITILFLALLMACSQPASKKINNSSVDTTIKLKVNKSFIAPKPKDSISIDLKRFCGYDPKGVKKNTEYIFYPRSQTLINVIDLSGGFKPHIASNTITDKNKVAIANEIYRQIPDSFLMSTDTMIHIRGEEECSVCCSLLFTIHNGNKSRSLYIPAEGAHLTGYKLTFAIFLNKELDALNKKLFRNNIV